MRPVSPSSLVSPCFSSSRAEEWLCDRSQKRLRTQGPLELPGDFQMSDAGKVANDSPKAVSSDSGVGSYGEANSLLRGLHAEQAARRRAADPSTAEAPTLATTPAAQSDVEVWQGATRFAMSDVVMCRHGPGGCCLQCAGRTACNVPAAVYGEYCRAFQGVAHFSHPSPDEARRYSVPARSLVAGEVEFAAFAALVSSLGVVPGERFLDLGSGLGRAAVAWALLMPQCTAAGIEIRPSLHEAAQSILAGLGESTRQRIHLHCGDCFECDWSEATVLLVNSTGFDDALMARVAAKLSDTAAGTRIVTLSQPLPSPPGAVVACPPAGLTLVSQALYRMTWGNATAYVYRRVSGT
mmetsp:Transcript_73972/g.128346  ORF Transcript_73972/g.128346 Transcript_73972/m.128346 type:complete len:352 (-) Transcript_73972:63-1118(-)